MARKINLNWGVYLERCKPCAYNPPYYKNGRWVSVKGKKKAELTQMLKAKKEADLANAIAAIQAHVYQGKKYD